MDWQTVSALTIVGLAVGWLLRHAAQACRGTAASGCSHCPSRATGDAVKSLPLVQIQSPSALPPSRIQKGSDPLEARLFQKGV